MTSVPRHRSWTTKLVVVLVGPCAVLLATSSACRGPHIPGPELGEHAGPGEGLCVPYPPPAAKPEELPERPSGDAVWVDGEWDWQTRRYVWKPGEWVVPPPRSFYARSKLERLANGAIAFFPGHWHGHDHSPTAAEVDAGLLCPAPPKPTEAMSNVGDVGAEVDAHVGPVLVFAADAPSAAPPRVEYDAVIPGDAVASDAPPQVIQPPD